MNFAEFQQRLPDNDFPILFFWGEESYFREQAVTLLKSKYLQIPEMDLDLFDSGVEPSAVVGILNSSPFINAKRLVIVKEYYPTAKELANSAFFEFFSKNCPSSVLVFINERECSALSSASGVVSVSCDRATPSSLRDYAERIFEKEGISVSSAAISLLVASCNGDLMRLSMEVNKLCAFAADSKTVGEGDVKQLVSCDVEMQVYELSAALSVRNANRAIEILNVLLRNNEKPQIIFISIYNAYRRMLHVRLSEKSDAELSKILGVKEYAVKKSRQTARAYSKKALKKACDFLSTYDYKMKSGLIPANGLLPDCIQYLASI